MQQQIEHPPSTTRMNTYYSKLNLVTVWQSRQKVFLSWLLPTKDLSDFSTFRVHPPFLTHEHKAQLKLKLARIVIITFMHTVEHNEQGATVRERL